jgi:DNA-binding response OmpR family regulator
MTTTGSILVVDDQATLLQAIRLTLETAGYQVFTASSGQDALDLLQQNQIDLILADIAMPQMNGYQLYEHVRDHTEWVTIPFLFLTARAMDSDIRYGKQLGVDDYLTKPVQPEDLLAVVEGKLRRSLQLRETTQVQPTPSAKPSSLLTIGQLQIDPAQYRVWMRGEPVHLSAREFTLLEYLAQRLDNVIPAQDLVQATHQIQTSTEEAGTLLRPLIRTIRRKLGYPVGDMGCIDVVRGVGYRLTVPE